MQYRRAEFILNQEGVLADWLISIRGGAKLGITMKGGQQGGSERRRPYGGGHVSRKIDESMKENNVEQIYHAHEPVARRIADLLKNRCRNLSKNIKENHPKS